MLVNERDNLILVKRIDESEKCILLYLLQCLPWIVFAIWYHTVPYGAIWFHMVKASSIWLSAVRLRCALQSLMLDCNKDPNVLDNFESIWQSQIEFDCRNRPTRLLWVAF
jgi:hypothetical protein